MRFNLIYGKNKNLFGIDTGLINDIEGILIGTQDGIYNKSGTVLGFQSGFLNTCDELYGLQFGFINIAKRMTGVQIGLLNFHLNSKNLPFMPIINISF